MLVVYFRVFVFKNHGAFEAICKMVSEKPVEDLIFRAEERIFWQYRISEYSVREGGGLLWKWLKVSTKEQLEIVLQPIR